jgi:hypothetical protein
VQWGIIYVAGAWGFLQSLEHVSDAFEWPPAVRQVALLVLLIGLPIVLVLAWTDYLNKTYGAGLPAGARAPCDDVTHVGTPPDNFIGEEEVRSRASGLTVVHVDWALSSQITTAAPGTASSAGQSHRVPSPTAHPTPANPPPPAAPIGLEVSHPLQLRPRISADDIYF